MNTNKYILWYSCWITILIGIVSILIVKHVEYQVISSPVEEMYHRQLVVTLDSILDARFSAGCCEEDSNTGNANTFRNRFDKLICPMD